MSSRLASLMRLSVPAMRGALCGAMFVVAMVMLPGCSLFEDGQPEEAVQPEAKEKAAASHTPVKDGHGKQVAAPAVVDPDEFAELQLKHARLIARMEELEGKFSRQQERLKIIERGLTLGIVPDELKAPAHDGHKPVSSNGKKAEKPVAAKTDHSGHEADDLADASPAAKPAVQVSEQEIPAAVREEFDKAFASAHDDFRAGRYGKAIVEFSEIGKKYDARLTAGMHKFWIARCWSGLKEMQTARQLFSDFIGAHPQSPWAPRAKLELARVESALGLKETAIKRLRNVISEHPMEDVAEMAKAEVERMSKTL